MPQYDYSCARCGWKGDRVVSINARDNQTCDQPRPVKPVPQGIIAEEDAKVFALLDQAAGLSRLLCSAPLVREELSGVNASMKMNWRSA